LDVFRCRTKCGANTVSAGAINAQVRAAKLFFEFFKGTLPNHYFWCQNRVCGSLEVFRCRTKCCAKTVSAGAINAQVRAAKLFFDFFKETLPNHYFRSQNHIWRGSAVFRCHTKCCAKTVSAGAINAQVRAAKLFFDFFKETLPNHYIWSQNHI